MTGSYNLQEITTLKNKNLNCKCMPAYIHKKDKWQKGRHNR